MKNIYPNVACLFQCQNYLPKYSDDDPIVRRQDYAQKWESPSPELIQNIYKISKHNISH